jgi:protein-disulfide isomerase-like protein with CxxC motif
MATEKVSMDQDQPEDNRAKKLAGRTKRRRYVQGTRAYTHAIANSIAKRAGLKQGKSDSKDEQTRG